MKIKNLKRFAALSMALCLSLSLMTAASASNEATSSGGTASSDVTLSSTEDGSLGTRGFVTDCIRNVPE